METGHIGIRREDKNIWEKRVPLVPRDIRQLISRDTLKCTVQPSLDHRAIPDEEYIAAGAVISEHLDDCAVIFGVKEIPPEKFLHNRTYVFFSHVIKGQPYNMPMLRQLMTNGCSLIDYERIEDSQGRRLIFFGKYAGRAGMVETLHALGQRLLAEGMTSPFAEIKQPSEYKSLAHIKEELRRIGGKIAEYGVKCPLPPVICGFTGYGNVSQGAQEIYDLLPVQEISPEQLEHQYETIERSPYKLYKVVFKEKHMFQPAAAGRTFDLNHYFKNPSEYISRFDRYVSKLTLLVNGIYWTESCPRLVTKDLLRTLYSQTSKQRLKVIGDISCDITGSIEMTVKATTLDQPTYVYDPIADSISDGVAGNGPVIMAIENLPCEIPTDASHDFSEALTPFVASIATADFSLDYKQLELPDEVKRALIVHHGRLTPDFKYIQKFLDS